jgi:hypothetical protein
MFRATHLTMVYGCATFLFGRDPSLKGINKMVFLRDLSRRVQLNC